MPLLTRFDTPAALRDFPPGSAFYDRWSEAVSRLLGNVEIPGAAGPEPAPIGTPVGGFFNPHLHDGHTPVAERVLVWMGFPRDLLITHRDDRQRAFELGEARGVTERNTQVEYFEWRVTREGERIKKVTFVTETERYWQEMFDFDPDRVLELYQTLVDPAITMDQITTRVGATRRYNPLNDWNTSRGIVHYIVDSPQNTLEAAVGLVKGSVGGVRGRHVRDNYEITGGATTSADPRVFIDVEDIARKNLWVTFAEAIGLYMIAWDDTGWTKPDGSPVGNYWKIVRGRRGAALRLEYEVPAAEGFDVSDIKIGGRPIRFGGHLAEHITVSVVGRAALPSPRT
jgi:hypothetical protein